MKVKKIKNYFPGSNTTDGFYSFYEFLPYKCEKIYIIKGGPGTGKSTAMKKIGDCALEKGFKIEYHWCSSDNNSIDGIVIPDKKIAFFDGTEPHLTDPKYPGALEEILNFCQFWDEKVLKENKQEIISLNQKIKERFSATYNCLKIAGILDQEQNKYQKNLINKSLLTKLKNEIYKNINPPQKNSSKTSSIRKLFGSAITPQGQVSYINSLTKDIKNKYIIKGKPIIEKSKIIKEAGKKFQTKGYSLLYLYCGFNPEYINTLIIPELDTVLINKTKLDKSLQATKSTKIFNLNETLHPEKISNYSKRINDLNLNYNKFINKAVNNLSKAKSLHDQLENIYIKAMDFKLVDNKINDLIEDIF